MDPHPNTERKGTNNRSYFSKKLIVRTRNRPLSGTLLLLIRQFLGKLVCRENNQLLEAIILQYVAVHFHYCLGNCGIFHKIHAGLSLYVVLMFRVGSSFLVFSR